MTIISFWNEQTAVLTSTVSPVNTLHVLMELKLLVQQWIRAQ